jgi:DNA-binding MarR family transcriptional regulator
MTTPLTQTSQIQKKWGGSLSEGFLVVPAVLIRRQKELGLDCTELAVLLNLLLSWWNSDTMPFPRSATIGTRIGVTARTVQRALKSLEDKRLIQRIRTSTGAGAETRSRTRYDLAPVAQRLQELARPRPQTWDLDEEFGIVLEKGEYAG